MAHARICTYIQATGHKYRFIKKSNCITVVVGKPHPCGEVTVPAKLPSVGWVPRREPDGRKTAQGHCVKHPVAAHDVILQRKGEQ